LARVADVDRGDVQKHAGEVDEHAAPEADVVTIVAMERRADRRILADGTEQTAQERGAVCGIVGARGIERLKKPLRPR
jgi:hypothetical protein